MRFLWSALACLAACLVAASGAGAVPLVATDGTNLVKFDSATPGTVVSVPVTGLVGGGILQGIDYRPLDSKLYGVTSMNRLFTIDPATGVATQVGSNGDYALNGMAFGLDFSPVTDRLRVVSDDEQNFRINPSTGLRLGTMDDTSLNPIPASVVAAAYTNNRAGATSTTLYDIDSTSGKLMMQGGAGGTPSPNGGALTEVGPLGVTPSSPLIGFDIAPDGTAFANIKTGATTGLYTINLATGAATLIGNIGSGATTFGGLAASNALLEPAGPGAPVAEGAAATIIVSRSGSLAAASSVDYSTQAGTAASGTDFTPASGTLSWAPGDASAKGFSIPVASDADADDGETFDVAFSNAVGTGLTPTKVTVAISNVPPATVTLPPADTRKPKFSLSLKSKKLRTKLKLKVKTDEACKFKVDVKRKKTRVGSKSKSLKVGKTTVTVKLKRKKLKRVRKVTLKASATCTDAAGNKGKDSKKLKLKR